MLPFQLSRVPAIRFAPGLCAALGGELTAAGIEKGPVLVVADPGLLPFGFIAQAEAGLAAEGYPAVVFTGIGSDPKEAQVEAAIALAIDEACVAVVALGGGSALDAGKVAAVACRSNGPLARYRLAAEQFMPERLPVIAIPTTAGTGSETTAVSILSSAEGVKYWFWSPSMKPDRVLLDPVLSAGLPPHLTAATGLDAIVHAMEAATNRNRHPAIGHYAYEAIRLARANLPRAVEAGDHLDARGAMLLAASYAGVAIDNAGTALAHCAGHALGSLARIHHGRAVAISMAATFEWIMAGHEPIFDGVAEAFGVASADLPKAFADFVRALPVAPIGAEGGDAAERSITAQALARQMAEPENRAMRLSTARDVGDDDLQGLAERILAFR